MMNKRDLSLDEFKRRENRFLTNNPYVFLIFFAIYYVLMEGLYFLIPDSFLLHVIHHYGIVQPCAKMLSFLAPHEGVREVHGMLVSPLASLSIVRGCDGSGVIFLLVSGILAYSTRWRGKLCGILGAFVLIYIFNQARLVGLYFVEAYHRDLSRCCTPIFYRCYLSSLACCFLSTGPFASRIPMLTRRLFDVSWRLLFVWIVISVVGLLYGQKLLEALLPLFNFVITLAQDEFRPTLDIAGMNGEMNVRMAAKVIRSIPLSADQFIQPGTSINYTAISVLHALVPAVLLLTLILAWPIDSWLEGMSRGLLSVPAFFLVMLMTTPLFLAGRFQMAVVDMAKPLGGGSDDTLLILWAILLEMGGNWLLPILIAVFCILNGRQLAENRPTKTFK